MNLDERFMRRAIKLSTRGFPAPNPHVGCVIALDGEIVGEGFHRAAGLAHAEVDALNRAGGRARGGTAYVTLEPCNHHGRTGPCSEALIGAGVRRVVYAVPDPNPRASGGGTRLREAGLTVEVGLLETEARAANRLFLHAMKEQRPFVTLKAAIGLDGRLCLPDGRSQWITGPSARRAGMKLRAEHGCVLIGARTAIADDPLLTARLPGVVNQPLRVILAERPLDVTNLRTSREAGEVVTHQGPVPNLLADLRKRGIIGVLVEGGARTHAQFLASRLVDRIELFVAPRILGDGPVWTDIVNWPGDPLGETPTWSLVAQRKLGDDLHLTYEPRAHMA